MNLAHYLFPLALLGCAHRSTSAPGMVVTMTRLSVTATPENNPSVAWDRGQQDSQDDDGCGLLVALDLVAPPGVGALASVACSMAMRGSSSGGESRPEDPDLFVRFKFGVTTYDSPTIADQVSHDWPYSLFIPDDALRDAGLHLAVYDRDGGQQSFLVADHDLRRSDLHGSVELRGDKLDDPSLAVLRLEFANPPKRQTVTRSIQAREGLVALDNLDIPAGMLVEIRATGSYTIGSWNDAKLGPSGYPNGGPREYNLAGDVFRRANHGAAVAVLQQASAAQPIVVGNCSRFITSSGGTLHVGVNDSDSANNSGTVSFEVLVTTPDAKAWASGAVGPCQD